MDYLFLTRADLEPFAEDKTVNRLQGISGLYDRSTSTIGDRFSASFDYGNDSTIIRLSDDLQQISVSGVGPASTKLILMVTRVLEDETLRLFDVDYSFDAELSKTTTEEELRSLVRS